MAKQLNVALNFTANTEQAKAQMQDLQQQLNKLTTNNFSAGSHFGLTPEIQKASQAAAELSVKLKSATDINTGKLDLGKFIGSLDDGFNSLKKYQNALSALGPAGDKAFASLAMSIAQADMPLRRTSGLVNELWTTLKNTARWQLSSSILHGFMGAVQGAFGYAQDLNESLNNIRIVTGQNVDQMAKFAEQANRSAKALSTTTTEYTNASLIYYQQGLSDAEVKERTDVTVKMANAAGVSAQTVSDQMTAVWNNFDDGSKSLEYYADVMTALGAATASSTDEIAAGLEKFAAVSETVGLSYEYATAALATVTATTRQSADVVGNAFKTLFARIQGLNLGETLDDGTTLNKYSQALEKVGISIFEQNGQMKEMDTILNEMGAKWNTLDKAQQTALAQTVAGVRQYTQLIALMDNWDYFGENLQVALGSEGTLNKQAEIYAESWEAARKRVSAATQDIYQSLINDEFIIDILNGFEKIITLIDNTIDGLGGFKGAFSALGVIFFKVFSTQLAEGFNNFKYSLTSSEKKMEEFKIKTTELLSKTNINQDTTTSRARADVYQLQGQSQLALIQNAKRMSQEEQQVASILLDQQKIYAANVIEANQLLEKEEQKVSILEKQTRASLNRAGKGEKDPSNDTTRYQEALESYKRLALEAQRLDNAFTKISSIKFSSGIARGSDEAKNKIESLKQTISNLESYSQRFAGGMEEAFGRSGAAAIMKLKDELNKTHPDFNVIEQAIRGIGQASQGMADSTEKKFQILREEIKKLVTDETAAEEIIKKLQNAIFNLGEAENQVANDTDRLTIATKAFQQACINAQGAALSFGDKIVRSAQMIGTVSMAINSLIGLFDVWNNQDMTFGEKLISTMTTLGFVIPMVVGLFRGQNLELLISASSSIAAATGFTTMTAAEYAAAAGAKSLAVGIWMVAWPLLLIVGVIAAVSLALWGLSKAYNADANAAKDAAEAADQAKEAFEGTKTAVDDLKNSLEGIDEQRTALDSMTQGTDEWRAAVTALNDEVLGLIDTYPELAAAITENNGILEIDKNSDAYKTFMKKQEQQLENSRQSYLGAAINANNKQNASDITDFARSTSYADISSQTGMSQATNSEIEKAINALQDSNNSILKDKESFSEGLNEAGIINQSLIDALWRNREGLSELSASIQANTAANEVFNSQISQSYLSKESDEYKFSGNKIAMEKAMAEGLGDEDTSTWGKNYKGMTDKEIQKLYAEEMGLTWVKNKNGGIGEYVNAQGETVEINDSAARYYLNQKDALEANLEKAEEANSLLEANKGTENQQAILEAALTKNYKALTDEQLAMEGSSEELLTAMGFDANEIERLIALFGEDFLANIQAALDVTKDSIPEDPFNLSSWKDQFNLIKDLNIGDTISPEDFALLDEGMQEFFTKTLDGEYMLIAAADELISSTKRDLVHEINTQKKQSEQGKEFAGRYLNTIDESAYNEETNKYDSNKLASQLNFIREFSGDEAANELLKLASLDGDGNASYSKEDLSKIAEAAAAAKVEYEALNGSIEQNQQMLAMSANSVEELADMYQSELIGEDAFNKNLEAIAIQEAQNNEYDVQAMLDYADALMATDEAMVETREEALRLSLANQKMQKGISKLSSNIDKWSKSLKKNANTLDSDYIEAIGGTKDALADMMDVDISTLSDDFVIAANESGLLEEAANGSAEALNKLKEEYRISIVLNQDSKIQQEVSDLISEMESTLATKDLEVGMSINQAGLSGVLDSFNSLLQAGEMTVADLTGIFESFSFSPDVTWEAIPIENASNQNLQYYYQDSMGNYVAWDGSSSTASDGYVYLPSINGNTTSYKGAGGGGGGSKGGGGGGSKKLPEKKNDSDKTRYHTLQNQLEDLQSEYEAISEAADRAFGADKLAKMDDEIAKTDELIEKQKEYINAIDANLPMDKAIMVEYYNEVIGGPEMEFDEKGNISNYDAIQDAMYKAWNEDYYNLPEEEREAWEEKYEKVEKYIEQYEETYDLLRDEEQALQDLINQRLDLLLEEVQYEVELKLNVSDDSLQLIEFQLDMLEDNAFKAAEAIEYQTEQAEILYDKMQANEQGLRDILATSDMSVGEIEQLLAGDTSVLDGHTFTEAQIEAIREYRDNLLDLSEELQEVREEVQERLLDAFDEWNEELDEGIEKFDHYNSIMENYKNMIEIVGKEYLKIDNKALGDLDQAMVENNINRVKATKDALDALTDTEIRARQAYEDAVARGNENDIQYWKETLETIGEEVESAEEEMMQAWEDALQAAADAFEAAVETAIENFEKALLPFGTLEQFSDAYEKQQELADQYLDDYQQIYELSKLNRDIANSIDDTKSIAGKQKLKGLMDDINKLQEEGTQLSKYDLEYLQKTYDLRMAEIALEEAQKAKDTVRLTRDNEGNWSYAYTTNTDAADDAAQKYEDALYAMQELSSEYIDEMSEQLISTSQEMEEALAAVRVEDYASIEEYYKKLDEIQQYYLDRMGYMQGEMQKALDNNKALYEQDWQNYSAATGYKISDDEKFAMSYKDTVLGTLFGSESDLVDFQERVNEALGTSDSGLIGELLDAYLQWSENTDDAMNAAGTSSEDFAEDMDTAVHGEDGIVDSSTAATEAVDKMATQMVAGFDTITTAVERWQSQVGDAADAVIKDYLGTVTAYNMMVEALSSNKVNKALEESLASHSARVSSYANSTNSTGSKNASDSIAESTYTTGDGPSAPDRSTSYYEFKAKQADRLATGGYTGNWGPDPKWALLDSAEIVLNEKDTSNFLSAISLTREMLNTIDLNAQQASVGLGAMVAGAIKQDILQGLEQSVHITAEFPSVTDHYEVEEALNNLINTSSQYANRK